MFEHIGANINVVIEKINLWIETFLAMLPNFVVAIIVLIVFYFVAKLARNIVGRVLDSVSNNISVTKLIATIVFLIVCTAGFFVALGILNLDKTVTSLLAGAGIIGLALSFAFQDTATNFISGVIIAFRNTLSVGDLVEVEGTFGKVERISLRSTIIKTPQGPSVMIPNKDLLQGSLKNYNSQTIRRVDIEVGVGYESDLDKVESVTIEAIQLLDLTKKEKGVELYYHEFGGSSINFTVRFWIDFREQSQFLKAQSEAIKKINKVYNEHNFNIPFPIRTLDLGMAKAQWPQLFSNKKNGAEINN